MEVSTLDLKIWRGDAKGGELVSYRVPVREGMVVLDAVLWVQANAAADLGVRWNCKAAKCGSCSAETQGFPLLKGKAGLGYCNITKCCTEVCPEHIKITDNAIIPLKERMDDRYFDPIRAAGRLFRKNRKSERKERS